MVEFGFIYTPDNCEILPSLAVNAGRCDHCSDVHAVQIAVRWTWWGFAINFIKD